ncbi:MAG: transglutaminase-like domain-containing protein [Pseudomonadota bacterium]
MRLLRSKAAVAVSVVLLLTVLAFLASLLTPTVELTRFRNSLLAELGTPADFNWTPENLPVGYRAETLDAPAPIRDGAASVQDFETTVDKMTGLVGHLRSKPKKRGPIKSDTLTTYRIIRTEGRGYCADYTQVFNALAHGAKLPVREWGMSFDRFGGDGHAFSEVYDALSGNWVFVDPMHGFFVRSAATGQPLSVLEFRAQLTRPEGFDELEFVPIDDAFMFDSARKAYDYYRDGADQFFLWFGNDVFSYDAHGVVQTFGFSRSVEQLAAIIVGVHPKIRVLGTATNGVEIESLMALRNTVLSLVGLAALLGCIVFAQVLMLAFGRRRSRS